MLRRSNLYWPFAIAALALAARLLPTPRTIDDAFITFRYARNVVGGLGFVYNAGERVLGTTTPLYTLLLAALSGLSGWRDYAWLALGVNALADALTCLVLVRLGERLTGRRAVGLSAALLWAIAPMSVTFAIGGMETSVCILLLILSADCYLAGQMRWAALAAGLLLLTRPDGALFVAPLIADALGRGLRAKKLTWAEAGIFLLTLAPWAIFATLYFGSPLPHSITAKTLAYRLPPEAALVRLIQHYGTPFFEHNLLGTQIWPLVGFVLYLLLSLIGGLVAVRRNSRAWVIAIYPALYFIVFAAAHPLIFRWYLAPPLPFYSLLILGGLAKLLGDLEKLISSQPPAASRQLPAAVHSLIRHSSFPHWSLVIRLSFLLPVALFILTSLSEWRLRPDRGPARPAPDMAWHQLELLYAQVGRDLAPRVGPQTVIAAGDVGALGYYSNARILDTVGLISPEASRYYPLDPALYVIAYAVPPQLILNQRPDYVVLLEVYGRNGLFADPRFLAEYELTEKIPTDIYSSEGMLVWRRK